MFLILELCGHQRREDNYEGWQYNGILDYFQSKNMTWGKFEFYRCAFSRASPSTYIWIWWSMGCDSVEVWYWLLQEYASFRLASSSYEQQYSEVSILWRLPESRFKHSFNHKGTHLNFKCAYIWIYSMGAPLNVVLTVNIITTSFYIPVAVHSLSVVYPSLKQNIRPLILRFLSAVIVPLSLLQSLCWGPCVRVSAIS